jgi:hypothetical protein
MCHGLVFNGSFYIDAYSGLLIIAVALMLVAFLLLFRGDKLWHEPTRARALAAVGHALLAGAVPKSWRHGSRHCGENLLWEGYSTTTPIA